MSKHLLASAALLFVSISSGWAISGGPFDNDSQTGTQADGFHAGVLRGKNLVGVMQLPIGILAAGRGGIFGLAVEGETIKGTVFGVADFPRREISGVFDGREPGTFEVLTTTTIVNGVAQTERELVEIPGGPAGGEFTAKIKQSFPSLLWEGKGTFKNIASLDADADADADATIPFRIYGLRVSLFLPAQDVFSFGAFFDAGGTSGGGTTD